MTGKEPEIFTRDRDKVEEFMTSWSIYQGINKQTRVMNNPMSQTMPFFRYLRGPKMHLWIKKNLLSWTITYAQEEETQMNGSGTL